MMPRIFMRECERMWRNRDVSLNYRVNEETDMALREFKWLRESWLPFSLHLLKKVSHQACHLAATFDSCLSDIAEYWRDDTWHMISSQRAAEMKGYRKGKIRSWRSRVNARLAIGRSRFHFCSLFRCHRPLNRDINTYLASWLLPFILHAREMLQKIQYCAK